jgi:hypothetical protein
MTTTSKAIKMLYRKSNVLAPFYSLFIIKEGASVIQRFVAFIADFGGNPVKSASIAYKICIWKKV